MFENTSEEFKSKLIDVLIAMEEKHTGGHANVIDTADMGTIDYVTPESSGSVPLKLTQDSATFYGPCAVIKRTDGGIEIVFKCSYFINSSELLLSATIAHELGHIVAGHFSKQMDSLPSLYREEIIQARNNNDPAESTRLTVKSIIDGAYLSLELEADIIGVKFVGLDRIIVVHGNDMVDHENTTVVLEKINRMRKLKSLFADQITPLPDYYFEVNLRDLSKVQN